MRYKDPPAHGLPDRSGICGRHCEKRSDKAILGVALAPWIDSLRSK